MATPAAASSTSIGIMPAFNSVTRLMIPSSIVSEGKDEGFFENRSSGKKRSLTDECKKKFIEGGTTQMI